MSSERGDKVSGDVIREYEPGKMTKIFFFWYELLNLFSLAHGSFTRITGFKAPTAHKHRVHAEDNEAGCYRLTLAEDYCYVISL